jgi:hypothetical protein
VNMADRDAIDDDLLRRLGKVIAQIEGPSEHEPADAAVSDEAIDRILGHVIGAPESEGEHEPPESGPRSATASAAGACARAIGQRADVSPWLWGSIVAACGLAALVVVRLVPLKGESSDPVVTSSTTQAEPARKEGLTTVMAHEEAKPVTTTLEPENSVMQSPTIRIEKPADGPGQEVRSLAATPPRPAPARVKRAPGPVQSLVSVEEGGFLTLESVHRVHVYLDGKQLGTTPLVRVRLPVGRHHLILESPELGGRSQYEVVIEPGKVVSKSLDWEPGGTDRRSQSSPPRPERRLGLWSESRPPAPKQLDAELQPVGN